MITLFQRSLYHRLLAAFLAIGIVPYLFIMLYFSYWGRESITQMQHERYIQQAEQSRQLIQSRIEQLEQEVDFLSRLEVFDDIIAADVDYRISELLQQKSNLGDNKPLLLRAVNLQGDIIAASKPETVGNIYDISVIGDKTHKIDSDSLLLIRPLFSSFDERPLGYLIAHYPLENLRRFMLEDSTSHFAITSKGRYLLGTQNNESHIHHTLPLTGLLEGTNLIYSVDETAVLEFINRFMLYLSIILLIGIALIVSISRRLTKQIVEPIKALTVAAESIISTKNYALRVHSEGIDESAKLAKMFNRLIETTGDALKAFSSESQFRMQRFIDLTDMFNHITQIDNEGDCIDAFIVKLNSLTPYDLQFIPHDMPLNKDHVAIGMYLTDFNTQDRTLYGYLSIGKNSFDEEPEERFYRSIAAMVMLQIERISLINKIKSASEAKSAFISGMSHELRTPLNAIIGFSQYLIAYEALSDEQMDTVAKIEKAAVHLLSMINDILDIAKIEAGKMEVSFSDVVMQALLQECAELISPLVHEKGLDLHVDIQSIESLSLHTDPTLCKQIIINLLSNAVKFTPSGSITLSAVLSEDQLHVYITDTGVGMSKENLLRVFDAFTQLKNNTNNKHKGTGLGLSLSRHIAQALGTKLLLESEGEGHGSHATLTFNL